MVNEKIKKTFQISKFVFFIENVDLHNSNFGREGLQMLGKLEIFYLISDFFFGKLTFNLRKKRNFTIMF